MNPDKILTNLIDSANGAKTHYEVWWALVNKAKPTFVPVMNIHSDFFRASTDAHYTSFFVYLAHLFDKRADSSSIPTYLTVAGTIIDTESLQKLEIRYQALALRAAPVIKARHKTVAHIDAILTEKEVFKPLHVTWNEIRDIIYDSCLFVEDLASSRGWSRSVGIPRDNRLMEATLRLIRALPGKA